MIILLRVLLLGGLVFLLWKAWRLLRPNPAPKNPEAFEATVKCEVCGTHVPQNNATQKNEAYYCGDHAPSDTDSDH